MDLRSVLEAERHALLLQINPQYLT